MVSYARAIPIATVALLLVVGGVAYGSSSGPAAPPAAAVPTPLQRPEPPAVSRSPAPVATTAPPPATTAPPPATTAAPPEAGAEIERCSAAGLSFAADPAGLPAAVAAARDRIARAAIACDWELLHRLTAGDFAYSYGIGRRPVDYWRELEAAGEAVTAQMVVALGMSFGVDHQFEQPIYYWPAALGADPGAAEWAELPDVYTEAELAKMTEFGGFTGHRHGIRADGDWRFFVYAP